MINLIEMDGGCAAGGLGGLHLCTSLCFFSLQFCHSEAMHAWHSNVMVMFQLAVDPPTVDLKFALRLSKCGSHTSVMSIVCL